MDPAMYIFVNKGLGMSAGKMGAQTAHAAVEAVTKSDESIVRKWNMGGHYKKLIMEARDTEHLLTIERYVKDRGFKTALIIDEGFTEIPKHTPTALGVEVVDKDAGHTAATFQTFDLYREPKPTRKRTRWPRCLTGFSNDTKGQNRA